MEARLRQALARAEEVARQLADPETARNPARLKQLGREHAQLDEIRQTHDRLGRLEAELAQAREVLEDRDPELSQLARADVERLRPEVERLRANLAELLTPRDPLDDRDAIVEIRAGTGGDEAALFAAELFRMYTRFAERKGWKVEVVSLSEGNLGGLKEAIFAARPPGGEDRLLQAPEIPFGQRDNLDLPALPLGEPGVHPEQLRGEQRRLVATGAGADLDDRVAVVQRIAGGQQLGEVGAQPRHLGAQPLDVGPGELRQLGVAIVEHFARLGELGLKPPQAIVRLARSEERRVGKE